jgi:hypothetical protein
MRTPPSLSACVAFGLVLVVFSPAAKADEPAPPAPRKGTLEFKMEPLTYAAYMREPKERHPRLSFKVGGEVGREVRAARVIITHAVDDTGRELQAPVNPTFFRIAVGSVSGAEFAGPIPLQIECHLSAVAPGAKTLKRVDGRVELVIPAMHPDATAVITNVPTQVGKPVDSELLRKAGITLEIHDRRTYEERMATYLNQAGGFTDYGVGVYFPASMLATLKPEARAGLQKGVDEQLTRSPLPKLGERDIALAVTDPEQRLVGFEFVGGDNSRLTYNRNGWAHYESAPGKRLDIYRLQAEIPADLKLVCWLAIDKSLVRIPLEMIDVPLPPVPVPAPKTPAPTPAPGAH